MITSISNKKIKDIKDLMKKPSERKAKGLFAVEGIKMFREIPRELLAEVFVSESFEKENAVDIPHETVTDRVFEYLSDTKTPQGILALVRIKETRELKGNAFLILDRIQDPGNLGTIMRTAEAAGIDGILMNRETADMYNPKVVRSTMGSVFRVPFIYTDDLEREIKKLNARVYAAHLKGEKELWECDLSGPVAFIIGNESAGISDQVAETADELIRIPMCGRVESLNASVAASVMMFELARQRR